MLNIKLQGLDQVYSSTTYAIISIFFFLVLMQREVFLIGEHYIDNNGW